MKLSESLESYLNARRDFDVDQMQSMLAYMDELIHGPLFNDMHRTVELDDLFKMEEQAIIDHSLIQQNSKLIDIIAARDEEISMLQDELSMLKKRSMNISKEHSK